MNTAGKHLDLQQGRMISASCSTPTMYNRQRQKTNQESILRLTENESDEESRGGCDDFQLAGVNQTENFSGDEGEESRQCNSNNQLATIHQLESARHQEQFKQQQINGGSHIQHQQQQQKDFDDVKQVELFGIRIVALTINGKERLCLAQISNTLLKEFSYNEIHNRRVALGITCVQCTPIQLEMLRRAGAMPSSSRRCGMITMREAERLCRSFLVEEQPPDLPENFYFTIAHRINYGCKGRFVPARYISSRAKCIECFYCGEFYSPNKFIFHSHRQPNATDCNPPDSPNINSWRKHIDLDWTQEHSQEIKYAWEDVKSLFNGGTRRRAPNGPVPSSSAPTGNTNFPESTGRYQAQSHLTNSNLVKSSELSDSEQLIDVDDSQSSTSGRNQKHFAKIETANSKSSLNRYNNTGHKQRGNEKIWTQNNQQVMPNNSLMLDAPRSSLNAGNNKLGCKRPLTNYLSVESPLPAIKQQRLFSMPNQLQNVDSHEQPTVQSRQNTLFKNNLTHQRCPVVPQQIPLTPDSIANEYQQNARRLESSANSSDRNSQQPINTSSNFIYSQLYNQLMQPNQQQSAAVGRQLDQQFTVDAHLALRHHLWSSLLANLQQQQQQTNVANDRTYTPFAHLSANNCNTLGSGTSALVTPGGNNIDTVAQTSAAASLGHLITAQFYGPAALRAANLEVCKDLELQTPSDAPRTFDHPTDILKNHSQLNETSSDT